jgi:hypothetical protein
MHGNIALLRKKKGSIMTINQQVVAELKAMKECGMRVPKKAFALAESDDMTQYECMSISEIADLIIDLA